VPKKSKDIDLPRLCEAIQRSRLALRFFREERREAVRQFAGNHWSEETAGDKRPLNLLASYVNIVSTSLIAKDPRVLLSTFDRTQKPVVSTMQSWCNREMERMHLGDTLERLVIDALFCIGIAKVALATPADAANSAWGLKAGMPYVASVDLDDWVYDIHARYDDQFGFVGHRYRVPLQAVKDSRIYSKARKELTPSRDQPYNLEGDERIAMLGRSYYGIDAEEYEDMVDLWEIYLPRHRLVLTLAADNMASPESDQDEEPLRVQRWLGPESGPYHILGYGIVPGNPMPKAPITNLIDLDDGVNRIFRKLIRQAERQKSLTGVSSGATEDGDRVLNASDGDVIRLDNPDKVNAFSSGGPSQENFALGLQLEQFFSKQAGNLDMMGGLSPQSKTATQDQLLSQNASRALAFMQRRTTGSVSQICKALCWYWYHNPSLQMRVNHPIPGLPGESIVRSVSAQQRMAGRWDDLEMRVDPYSLQYQSPESRLQAMNQVVTQIVLPMMQLLVQQGIAFDANAYLQKVGSYLDMPDLAEILTVQEPPQQDPAGRSSQGPGLPSQTERKYVRESRSGRTQGGNTLHLINSLMGAKSGGASPQAEEVSA
jgi:hypothetical protein